MAGEANAAPKRKIFINYRHTDHPDFVERIHDWFARKYGHDNVFMDIYRIPDFRPFAEFIRAEVRQCDVLVAIIGPAWLNLLQERMSQHDDEDYVQLEIRLALEEGKPVAPICIKQTPVPRARDLPPELRPMLEYHVAHLDSGRKFPDEMSALLESLEQELSRLDGLHLINDDIQEVTSDIMSALRLSQESAEKGDWQTALDWLKRIRQSGFAPAWYPLEDYENEAREGLHLQKAEQTYNFIRMMAQRALKGRESRERVWVALQDFWSKYSGYDPDDLASQFRPESAIELSSHVVSKSATPDDLQSLDLSIFNRLASLDITEAEQLFDAAVLAAHAQEHAQEQSAASLHDAQEQGIQIDWDANV